MAAFPCPLRRFSRVHAILRDSSLVDDSVCFRRQTAHPEPVEGNAKQQVKLGRGDLHGSGRFLIKNWLFTA